MYYLLELGLSNKIKIKIKPSKSNSKHAFKNIQKQLRYVLFQVTLTVPPWGKCRLFSPFSVKEPETKMASVSTASELQKLVFLEPENPKSHACSFPYTILSPRS